MTGLRAERNATVIFAAALMMVALGACDHSPSPAQSPTDDAAKVAALHPQTGRTDNQRLSAHHANPTVSHSFADLMQRLPPQKQAQVQGWYQRLGSPPMQHATAPQVAWMRARHYPMPEDIARAASMSEAELKAAANTGDVTAKILYVTRLLEEARAKVKAAGSKQAFPTRLWLGIWMTMPDILASGAPLAGFLLATRDKISYAGNAEAIASARLAALAWANHFGDTRAKDLILSPRMQAVSAPAPISRLRLMAGRAHISSSKLFVAPVVPMPPANH